ncbi:dipeptidase [bacterium]|nr:dipeptidase [bacterium]
MKGISGFSFLLSIILLFTFVPLSAVAQTEGSPVTGFADIHIHQMAEFAYAGAWFHGSHKGPESVALKKCSGGSLLGGDHARTVAGPLNELLGSVPGTDGDTGWHFYKRYGYPKYTGWPRWDTIAHQQVWEGHLKQAHDNGLSLYIMSAVDFKPLCDVMPKKNKKPGLRCNEMSSVQVQLQAAIDFAAERNWISIARSPEEAREINDEGKLAVILAIEVTQLFDDDNWAERLNYYYDHYHVRSIQLGHQLDNRFTGVAPHHFIFKLFQFIDDINNGDSNLGFDLDDEGKNRKGLTSEGMDLIRAMMDKKMILDIAHMSERAIMDLYDISIEYNYYPFILSHGHLRSIMLDKKQKEEKTTPDSVIRLIRETGGMIGLRTAPDQVKTYTRSGVPNDCDGSSKSFAQAYQYGVKGLKVDIAFASDFNGFIQQTRPRFGSKKETCAASGDNKRRDKQRNLQKNPLGTPFDYQGFGHIGLEGDIVRELKNLGVETSGLENSAETFVRVWERCYDQNRVGPLDTSDFDTSGIVDE